MNPNLISKRQLGIVLRTFAKFSFHFISLLTASIKRTSDRHHEQTQNQILKSITVDSKTRFQNTLQNSSKCVNDVSYRKNEIFCTSKSSSLKEAHF